MLQVVAKHIYCVSQLPKIYFTRKGASLMNETIFNIILLCIPVLGAVISGLVLPLIKSEISAAQLNTISKWVEKAVQAAEILFDAPECGEAKRAYVIRFISQMFNSKKETITEEQIRILLEAALLQISQKKAA